MTEFSWKRLSLRSLRLIWKTSLQMLSRLFPLTHSWGEMQQQKHSVLPHFPEWPCDGVSVRWTQETHSEAELGDAQVELRRVEVYEAEQHSEYR